MSFSVVVVIAFFSFLREKLFSFFSLSLEKHFTLFNLFVNNFSKLFLPRAACFPPLPLKKR
nr:MAG TPA: hypothetical protein [Caudoviricetes sp.]